MGFPVLPIPRLFGIQARSVSDGIGVTIDATSCVASDPPAYAGGLYGESVSDGMPSPSGLVRRVMRA